jgi:hypothetical protein
MKNINLTFSDIENFRNWSSKLSEALTPLIDDEISSL